MIPNDDGMVYAIHNEVIGLDKARKNSVGKQTIIVSRVPTQSKDGLGILSASAGNQEEAKTVVANSSVPSMEGRDEIVNGASGKKTVTGTPRSRGRNLSSRRPVSKVPPHKDFIRYFPGDELISELDDIENESEFNENTLGTLKKKHNTILDIEDDAEDLAEEDNKVENVFLQELEQNKTVRKPFERGSNILIFVAIATGTALYIGYSFMTLFLGGATRGQKQDQKQEESQLLMREKNPLQERIDELEAERAISLQKDRFRDRGNRNDDRKQDKELGNILSTTKLEPDLPGGIGNERLNKANTNSSTPKPSPSPSPTPSPVATNQNMVASVPPPPPVVIPPAPEPNTRKLIIDYLTLRQNAQQFGSFGIGSSSLKTTLTSNSLNAQVRDRNTGVGPSNEFGPLLSPPLRGSAELGSEQSLSVSNRPLPSPTVNAPSGQMTSAETGNATSVTSRAENNSEQIAIQQAEQQFLSRMTLPRLEVNYRAQAPVAQILPGSRAQGRIMSPIYSIENFKDESRYSILIEDDILDANGQVRIPRHSMIMAEVNTMPGGVVIMKPVTLVLHNREVPIPPGSVDIRGRNKPLIGKRVSSGQITFLKDNMLLFLLGGLQSAAELANRPRTTSSITNTVSGNVVGSTSSSTTTTPEPDYAAAVLQGGLSKVLPGLESKLKQQESRDGDPRIYQISAGTTVDIYITRPLSLEL